MSNPLFANHHHAALALLEMRPTLTRKEAGFLGHVCIAPLLSPSQFEWLNRLLEKSCLPALKPGV